MSQAPIESKTSNLSIKQITQLLPSVEHRRAIPAASDLNIGHGIERAKDRRLERRGRSIDQPRDTETSDITTGVVVVNHECG